jgi:hypothetical protein
VKERKLAVLSGILVVLALAAIPVSNSTAVAPLSTDTLSVCPDYVWQPEGAVFAVGICVPPGITDLMGYNVTVAFDSSVIEILNAVEGQLPRGASDATFFWWFDSGAGSGTVHVNGAILGATANGPGVLFTLVFKALHSWIRTTDVCITQCELRDGINDSIAHERRCGLVEIESGPSGIEPPASGGVSLEGYPNPFNPSVTLVLSLPGQGGGFPPADVSLGIYAADGRLVRSLLDEDVVSGEKRFVWDGKNENGEEVSSGVYFAAVETEAGTLRTKLVLVR